MHPESANRTSSYTFRFMPLLSFPLPLWFVFFIQVTMGELLYSDAKKNIMETDYYIVGNLRKDYEESYSKLGHRWKDYAQRKYDIIDKVQKDGLLLVGINPSFDESFEGPCEGEVRDSENGGYRHPYFTKPKKLNEDIGISSFSHVDMFFLRSRPWCFGL